MSVTFMTAMFILHGSLAKSSIVVALETIIKMSFYYVHELGWDKVKVVDAIVKKFN
jgi:uncharacterized membrane protein